MSGISFRVLESPPRVLFRVFCAASSSVAVRLIFSFVFVGVRVGMLMVFVVIVPFLLGGG